MRNDVKDLIDVNNRKVHDIEALLSKISDKEEILRGIELVCCLYAEYITGIYSSRELEEQVIKVGECLDEYGQVSDSISGHVLIVMTEAGSISGHTSLVNNWIAHDRQHVYSIIFTSPGIFSVPKSLEDIVNSSGGRISYLNDQEIIERAKKLKNYSGSFERIILFTHMYDVVPVLAYSSPYWKIPIYYYHHADFRFVFGLSVCDFVFTINEYDKLRIERLYGVDDNCCDVLRVPGGAILSEQSEDKDFDQNSIRKQYDISLGAKLVVSMGADYKYQYIEGYDFAEFVQKLVSQYKEEICFLIIGADRNNARWISLANTTEGKARAMGEMPIEKAVELIKIADLYVASFPMRASGANIAAKYKVPVITLSICGRGNEYWNYGVFGNIDEMVDGAIDILNDCQKQVGKTQIVLPSVSEWENKWAKIYKQINKHCNHGINPIREVEKQEIINYQLMQKEAAFKTFLFLRDRLPYSEEIMNEIFNLDYRIAYPFYKEYHAYKPFKAISEGLKQLSDKHLNLFRLALGMTAMKQSECSINAYFNDFGFHDCAIYGVGELGRILLEEIERSEISCLYCIDKNADNIDAPIKIYTPRDSMPKVDVIINSTTLTNQEIMQGISDPPTDIMVSVGEILSYLKTLK